MPCPSVRPLDSLYVRAPITASLSRTRPRANSTSSGRSLVCAVERHGSRDPGSRFRSSWSNARIRCCAAITSGQCRSKCSRYGRCSGFNAGSAFSRSHRTCRGARGRVAAIRRCWTRCWLARLTFRWAGTATRWVPLHRQTTNRLTSSREALRRDRTPQRSAMLRSRVPTLAQIRRIWRATHTPRP